MKDKTRLVITGAVALVAVAATVGGHGLHFEIGDGDRGGEETARTLPNLRNFDGVTLVGPDDVVITQGRDFAVKAEGDAEALDRLEIAVRNGTLHVGRKSSSWFGRDGGSTTIRVTLPALARVSLTGPGDMTVDKLSGKQVKAEITGPGNLSIGELSAQAADLDLTGSGDLDVAGKAATATLSTTGSGTIDADRLAVDRATLKLIGSGDIRVHVAQSADISSMGSGDAHVTGTNSCKISKMGSGEAECVTG